MKITHFSADGYKNLNGVDISPDESLNVFCGKNAQGKTNLIEAIWLCTGCKSFRLARDRSFIGFDKEKAAVKVSFEDSVRQQEIAFEIKKNHLKEKTVTLNGVKLPLMSRLFGNLKCVIFTPDDLSLLKGSPDNRRSFMDLSASQLKPSFVSALNKYNNLLAQRNAVIKNIGFGISSEEDLDIWDSQLASTGAYISVIRNTYCRNLNEYTRELYNNITNSIENMEIYYSSTVYKDLNDNTDFSHELADIYYDKLKRSRRDDVRVGYTLCGIHRDDLVTRINGLDAREFGSQGQQRSAAVVMKLAQAKIIGEQTGDTPVMLLDDVLSELDDMRKSFILGSVKDIQVFITCCDEAFISEKGLKGKIFRVENGNVYCEDN
ncbi:MAG: DNA replication/repair protein RecF [Oscillospiraceae bacterium]